MLIRNACHGDRIRGKSANATAMMMSAPVRTRRGPTRSESAPPRKVEIMAAAAFDATIRPARPSEMPRTLWR
jgi:hypothetical protein